MNMTARTLLRGHDHYVELKVVDTATGCEVWHVIHHHPPDADVPDYGMRGVKFINWADDSSSVTIPVGKGQKMTFAVP
jgi:hypothetical protein